MAPIARFLAGFAFMLFGLKLFSLNINQLTSHRFRKLVTRFTPNAFFAMCWGTILSILTAGKAILTPCIAGALLSFQAITIEKASLMVIWSCVGSTFFVYIAGYKLKTFILMIIGIFGLGYVFNKPKGWKTSLACVFSLGLILLGIQEIKESAITLIQLPILQSAIDTTKAYPIIALLAGAAISFCIQNVFGTLVIGISLVDTGALELEQAMLYTYGAYFGEGTAKFLYLPAFSTVYKRLIILLPAFYLLTFFIGVSSHFIERYWEIPLYYQFVNNLTDDPKRFFAHFNLALQLTTGIIFSLGLPLIVCLIKKIGAKHADIDVVKPLEIPQPVLEDPDLTLMLVKKEEIRLFQYVPKYFENVRSGVSLENPDLHESLHEQLTENFHKLHEIYSGLLNENSYDPSIGDEILRSIELQEFVNSLESNIYLFSLEIDVLLKLTKDRPQLSDIILRFVEALDVIILTMLESLKHPEKNNLDALNKITSERGEILESIRNKFSKDLNAAEQSSLRKIVNLFESSIWIASKISSLASMETHL
jgi:Na+/phosphate symporter